MTFEVPDPLPEPSIARQFAIVSTAARGSSYQRIMAKTRMTPGVIRTVAEHYGAPHLGRLEAAANKLRDLALAEHRQIRAEAGLELPTPTAAGGVILDSTQTGDRDGVEHVIPVVRGNAGGMSVTISPTTAIRALEQLQERARAAKSRQLEHRAGAMINQLQILTEDIATAEAAYQIRQDELATAARTEAEKRAGQLVELEKARKTADVAAKKAASEKDRAARLERELSKLTLIEKTRCREWARVQGQTWPSTRSGYIPAAIRRDWDKAGRP